MLFIDASTKSDTSISGSVFNNHVNPTGTNKLLMVFLKFSKSTSDIVVFWVLYVPYISLIFFTWLDTLTGHKQALSVELRL